jgi:hypothetical protein
VPSHRGMMSIVHCTAAALLTLIATAVAAPSIAAATAAGAPVTPDQSDAEAWQRVVDDTGTIAVTVPATWRELRTVPRVVLDTALPQVSAYSRPGGPGILVTAGVYVVDLEQQVCNEWYHDDCAPHEVAGLRGFRWFTQECCGGPGRWLTFVANPTAGQRVTVELTMSADDPEQPDPELLDTIASSVEVLVEPFPADWVVSATELAPPLPDLWPYGDFHDVPQLGTEPVRGSGCGADGSIGEVIPDGLWAGMLSYVPDDDHWEVNLVCIYAGEQAREVIAGGTANVIDDDDPDYVIVDNNPRTRSVPNRAESIETSFADNRTDGRCLGGVGAGWNPGEDHVILNPGQFEMLYSTTHQAWIRIHDGAVAWIRFGCDSELWPGPGG